MGETTVQQKAIMINVLTNPNKSVISLVMSCDEPLTIEEFKDVLAQYAQRVPEVPSADDTTTQQVDIP